MNKILLLGRKKKNYILKATFPTDIAAGSLNGTPVLPGMRDGSTATFAVTDTYATTEMITNGGFETAGSGGADVFGTWTETVADGAIADETTLVKSGSHAAKLTAGATANTRFIQSLTTIGGYTYTLSVWARGDGTNSGRYYIYDNTNSAYLRNPTTVGIAGTTYAQFTYTFTVPSNCISIGVGFYCPSTNTGIAYFDDVSVKPTTGLVSTSGGKLVFAGAKASPANGDPGVWIDKQFTRAAGLALSFKTTPTQTNKQYQVGFDVGKTTFAERGINIYSNGNLYSIVGGGTSVLHGTYTAGVEYKFVQITRSAGMYYFKYVNNQWELMYVDSADTTTPLYPAVTGYDAAFTVDDLIVAQLPAPFNTDNGYATDVKAGARSVGDTFTHTADGFIEWTQTAVGGVSYTILGFRRVDDDNLWRVLVAADGSLILSERVGGSNTPRGTGAAGSIANGQRMVVRCVGSTIQVYCNNVLKITYASATNFATATGGKVMSLDAGMAISDIATYPIYPTGTALSVLEKYSR